MQLPSACSSIISKKGNKINNQIAFFYGVTYTYYPNIQDGGIINKITTRYRKVY